MRFGIIGHPVQGSMSPRLFGAAYDGRYPYDLLDFDSFDDAWQCFLHGYDGINVTAPFKQDAFRAVTSLDDNARRSGAVNLVVKRPGGILEGHNTDVDGVLYALSGQQFSDVLVVGAGGAARAAVVAALRLGARVSVVNRTFAKAQELSAIDPAVTAVPTEEMPVLRPSLVIYTLPGRAPVPAGLPLSGAAVLEAEYKAPVLAGHPRYISGRQWLLGQAVAGYSLFTGEMPSAQKMLRVL